MPAGVSHIPPPLPPPLPPGVVASATAPPLGRDPTACANCGTPLQGPFCSHCGQHVRDLHRSTWRFVADFFENAFSWDNKLVVTLRPLLTRPGALTLDYLSGRRVRYVHPLRLFLFTSAICLTLIQYLGGNPFKHFNVSSPDTQHQQPHSDVRTGDASPSPAATAAASPAPADAAAPSPARQAHQDGDDDDDSANSKAVADALNLAAEKIRQETAPGEDHAVPAKTSPPSGEDLGRIIREAKKAKAEAQQKKEITADMQRRVSWVALALLPIFAAMLRGLYWRQDSYYFAHFVFSLHYHTFLLMFFASYMLLHLVLPTSFWPVEFLLNLCLLLPGVYLFLALRRLYTESRRRTVAKVCILGVMHLFVLFLGLTIVGGWAAYRALG